MPYCQCVSKCTTEDYPCQVNQCLGIMSFQILKVILSNLRFSLLRRIAIFQQRADQTQDQIMTRSERLTMKLGLIMDPDYPLLKNGKMDVSTWIPFCIFAKQLLPKPLPTSSKPRKMRFESSKTSTRKTENLAHLTYPHAECGMRN